MFKRTKNKVTTDFKPTDIYRHYAASSSEPVDSKTFISVLQSFNTEMLKMVLYDGADFNLPFRLGFIRIKKFDNSLKLNEQGEIANKLRPNWGKTLKKWKELYPDIDPSEYKNIKDKPVIYHLNEHTDGWAFRWYWDKITCNVINQSAYKFEPIRQIKREAAKAWKQIPNLKDKYYE
jgi:hypothetical protein